MGYPTDGIEPAEAFRTEHDALGDVQVPSSALYGAQTQRGIGNFAVSGVTLRQRPQLISALGEVKVAGARANVKLGELESRNGGAIDDAALEVRANLLDEHFPLDVVQGGGGTATNMNANEVIANRATELLGGRRGAYVVHPNDHVNRSQSTNDVYPTALQIAVYRQCLDTAGAVEHLAKTLLQDGQRAGDQERLGRTCLQDALPVRIRDAQKAEATALDRLRGDLLHSARQLLRVPLGATAVGTGFGAPPGFGGMAVAELERLTALGLAPAPDLHDALAHIDKFVAVSSALVRIALVMAKVASDLRLLSSGPKGGIGEVALPAVQVGSSIMPGKVNPVMPELVMQVALEVRAAGSVVEAAAATGELELNVMGPLVARHLLGALADVAAVSGLFADRCIGGLQWLDDPLREHLAGSLAERVARARRDGYAQVVAVPVESVKDRGSHGI